MRKLTYEEAEKEMMQGGRVGEMQGRKESRRRRAWKRPMVEKKREKHAALGRGGRRGERKAL